MSMSNSLHLPFTLKCGSTIKNRIAKSALSEGISEPNGRPSEALDNLYGRWGRGGAGILFTGNVMVDANHLVNANCMIADMSFKEDYSRLAQHAQVVSISNLVHLKRKKY